ncbi:MAG: TolC family protein, partial [Acetomicrobium sp.]|nr:TolC family protein [Acetomicrobium sp.]
MGKRFLLIIGFCSLIFLVLVMDKNAWGQDAQSAVKYNLDNLISIAEEHNPIL